MGQVASVAAGCCSCFQSPPVTAVRRRRGFGLDEGSRLRVHLWQRMLDVAAAVFQSFPEQV